MRWLGFSLKAFQHKPNGSENARQVDIPLVNFLSACLGAGLTWPIRERWAQHTEGQIAAWTQEAGSGTALHPALEQ